MIRKLRELSLLATSMTSERRALTRRVAFIGKRPKPLAFATLAVMALAAALCFCACTQGAAKKDYPQRLMEYKTPYIGDNAKVGGLLSALDFPGDLTGQGVSFALETTEEPYRLIAKFHVTDSELSALEKDEAVRALAVNALALFALVDNMDGVEFAIESEARGLVYQYGRPWADYATGSVQAYGESAEKLGELLAMEPYILEDKGYVAMEYANGQMQSFRAYPMTRENNALCAAAVAEYTQGTATLDGTEASAPPQSYVLREISMALPEAQDYYLFLIGDQPVMRLGEAGECKPVSLEAYNAVAALLGE